MSEIPASLADALRDRYRLERELGRGGMATVFLAHDLRHDRPVALKVLDQAVAAAMGSERFLLEIRVTARLQHAHILPLLDSGMVETAPGRSVPFFVMPYVEGGSLRGRLARERQLPVAEALRLAGDVAAALAYAHDHGVIHRDVKPENILVSNGQAIVADFGIARAVDLAGGERLTATGLALGTPHYMSPEQAAGDGSVDARCDVYALGCVLYEMLTGEPPFTGPTAQAIVARSLTEQAPPIRKIRATVPVEVERVITRALAKLPADRFAGASEFEAALSRAARAGAAPIPAWSLPPGKRRIAAVAAAVVLLAGAGMLLLRRGRSPEIIPSASSIAVLPFTPSGPDTALARLGRDLVYTLSAELDGLGGIRVVDAHTVLARATPGELRSTAEGVALARRFGAGSTVQGSLVRVGADVRLDLALLGADSAAAPLARATVTAQPDSVAALTDSAARALLAQIWSRGSPPTPSLDGALRTRSVPALRAFLQGEGEITQGLWDSAAVSYQRAMDADPTFWMAYARHVYARRWSLDEVADSVVAALDRHRFELPERERLSTESIILEDARDKVGLLLERARAAGERYPDSWFGWLLYGDATLHYGPLLGRSLGEAGTAFTRALELNPGLIPAWEHLMLVTIPEGDTARAGRALQSLDRLGAGPILTADGYGDRMLQFRFLYAVQRGDSTLARVLTDSLARDAAPAAVPDGSYYDAFRYGFFAQQVAVSRAALATGGHPPELQRMHRELLALSWGGRGAWDSALAGMGRLAAEAPDVVSPLHVYGLAALGVWLRAVDPAQALIRRAAAAQAAHSATGRADLAWSDGVMAAARGDRRELALARAGLARSGDPASKALDRSLAAFDAALRGAEHEAGAAMAALEWEQGALGAPDYVGHPLVITTNRLAAARWLASTGDAEQALRLLRWVDGAYLIHPSTPFSLMFAGLADLERGRVEEQLGRAEPARRYYERFLRRYDLPVRQHLPLVDEARARLRELGMAP